MILKRNKLTYSIALLGVCCLMFLGCGGVPKTTQPSVNQASKLAALQTLHDVITPAPNATVTTSTEIDWAVGTLPWDRFILPVFSPNGLHAAVQLGKSPSIKVLSGSANTPVVTTTIELHILDPLQGRRIAPLVVRQQGLLLTRFADSQGVLVEAPMGSQGRWIGRILWTTGEIQWLVNDNAINAFPTVNNQGDLAWSRSLQGEDRYHLVVKTQRDQRSIDDGKSDWLMPTFLGSERLRVYKLLDGRLSLVELDLTARDPLMTAMTLPLLESEATRALVWKISTTNPTMVGSVKHTFYHPARHRMTLWQPNQPIETTYFVPNSFAAAPAKDDTWLVSTSKRVIRQSIGSSDGIHLRNQLAIPIETTSKQWTHLILIPDGARLQVRAINLDN